MFFFVFFLNFLAESKGFDDKIVVVFSCKENINTRLKLLTETWFQQIPEVHVYLDDISQEEADSLVAGNERVKIVFHTMKNTAPFLIGSGLDTPEGRSRIRNILAIQDIYKQFPNKKWYYFAQDDTYLLPKKFATTFDTKDSSKPHIFGHSWYFFDVNYRFFSRDKTRLFYDIHGGFAVAQRMMKALVNNVDKIYAKYASPLIEQEIKLSALADASVPNFYGEVSNHLSWILAQSDVLKSQKERGYVGTDVVSFSYMEKYMKPFYESVYSEWKTESGETKMANLEAYAGQQISFELGTYGAMCDITFGFLLRPFNNYIFQSSPIKPIFKDNDKNNPIAYEQTFGKINVTYACDDTLENGELAVDGAQGIADDSITIQIKCPTPENVILHKNEKAKIEHYEYNWTQ